jgi:hypothetical protein
MAKPKDTKAESGSLDQEVKSLLINLQLQIKQLLLIAVKFN